MSYQPHIQINGNHTAPEALAVTKSQLQRSRLDLDTRRTDAGGKFKRANAYEILDEIAVHLLGGEGLGPAIVGVVAYRFHEPLHARGKLAGQFAALRFIGQDRLSKHRGFASKKIKE